MDNNVIQSFILDNCLSAASAIPTENNIYATDGQSCCIHIIKCNCCNQCCQSVLRPYIKLRNNTQVGQITALDRCNSSRIYLLSDNFCEEGYIQLNSSSCGCGGGNMGCLEDASLVCIGNEVLVVGVYPKGAFLFDTSGKRMTKLCQAEDGERLTDFIVLENQIYAMCAVRCNTQTITISDNGMIQSGILGNCLRLKMLIPKGNEVYGLFSQSYIYNKIIKIYSNGRLTLPTGNINLSCCNL